MSDTTRQQPTTQTQEAVSDFDRLLSKMVQIEQRMAIPAVQPMELRTFDELERWAQIACRSKMVPPSYHGKPDDIILAVQFGAELGLRPMQSLQNIAPINGKPAVYGDAMLALCQQHPLYVGVDETIGGEGDARAATCIARRKGENPKKETFSVADAKKAGLWGKAGPWTQYPDRMLKFRARGFCLRDTFPDKLRGLISVEEAMDYDTPPPASAAPPAVEQTRDTINAETAPKKRTVGEFMLDLEVDLRECGDKAAVKERLDRADVVAMLGYLKNGMLVKLQALMLEHRERVGLTLDDPDSPAEMNT